jgi:putative ABC transport system permease protein
MALIRSSAPRGSPLQLVLNTVYHLDKAPGAIPYSIYERLTQGDLKQYVRVAIPFAVGDTYKSLPIVGTTPEMFTRMEYRPDKKYEFAQGRVFASDKFEAVIGGDVAQRTGLKLGDTFHATHGNPASNETPDVHEELWTIIGILKPTHTAADRALYIPLISIFTIAEHEDFYIAQDAIKKGQDPNKAVKEFKRSSTTPAASAPAASGELLTAAAPASKDHEEKHYTVDDQGRIHLEITKDKWEITGVMVRTHGGYASIMLPYIINNGNEASAVNPASEMRKFFDVFLKPSTTILQLIAWLVTIVAGVGILVSIYNSVSARLREIAILRALGATRTRVLTLICLEAGLIGLVGGLLGLVGDIC